jgi:N6-L-threonylcarbamoyladenine synthase
MRFLRETIRERFDAKPFSSNDWGTYRPLGTTRLYSGPFPLLLNSRNRAKYRKILRIPIVPILTIESTCDETAAAIVNDKLEVLASCIATQEQLHEQFQGVVPEIAARAHVERIIPVLQQTLAHAAIHPADLRAIAVAQTPGLANSLLVGLVAAKTLAWIWDKPLIAINHLDAHVYACQIAAKTDVFPCVGLIVSGGHTHLFHYESPLKRQVLGGTIDDAAGEAFDKVANLLGLGFPGGPAVSRLAQTGNDRAFDFPQSFLHDARLDFSFSGLKTAVSRYLRENSIEPVGENEEPTQEIKDIAASFQATVVKSLMRSVEKLSEELNPKTLIVAGGVACNGALREAAEKFGASRGLPVYFPSKHLSTDNAAMIAAAGYFHLKRGEQSDLRMTADVTLRLQNFENEDAQLKKKKVRDRL